MPFRAVMYMSSSTKPRAVTKRWPASSFQWFRSSSLPLSTSPRMKITETSVPSVHQTVSDAGRKYDPVDDELDQGLSPDERRRLL